MVSYDQTPTGNAWWDHYNEMTHWNEDVGLMGQDHVALRIPTYVNDPAGTNFGAANQVGDYITELGLFQCTNDGCTAGSYVETVTRDASHNATIAIYPLWVNMVYDEVALPATATIRFSGEWLS